MSQRIWVTGSPQGQLYTELLRRKPTNITLLQPDKRLDITDSHAVSAWWQQCEPDVVINAAAYTAVDKAESDSAIAYAVNSGAVKTLATLAKQHQTFVVHVSTDFVFGSDACAHSQGAPISVTAPTNPVNVYGASKLAGEGVLLSTIAQQHATVRTAWVYSGDGNNFVKTMLRLMRERDELSIVADQYGAPTWTRSLADVLWQLAHAHTVGTWHWTGAGIASWYDFAIAIRDIGVELGLLQACPTITPIASEASPTPAKRPHFSVLDWQSTSEMLGHKPHHWREDLRQMLTEMAT